MYRHGSYLTMMALLSVSFFVHAESTPSGRTKPVEDAPKVQQGNVVQPQVKIIETLSHSMQEYRINGIIRAIKIEPKSGAPAYYVVDREGDGTFEPTGPDTDGKLSVPEWELFSW